MIIDITSKIHELSAEKIITTDGSRSCEYGHMITKGKIAWIDPADVILCQRHMIKQLAEIMTDE